jgi:galactonate dehydratase
MIRLALALPSACLFERYRALAAPSLNRVKITDIRAMAIQNIAGNCLIRIDTDSGLTGYGEAGATGPMARARIATMRNLLIGKDPLTIEVHFHNLTTLTHTYMAHIPTISGIDIALWDLAGKITGAPISTLLGGPFRESISLYSHGLDFNMLDKTSCRDWAQRIKEMPEGFTAFKNNIDTVLGVPSARFAPTLTTQQLRNVARGYANCREAVGDDIDIAVHCHNELDSPSAIGVAKAVEPMNPLFIEDALNPPFSEAWMALRRSTRLPLLTGEKLEMVRGFKPFLDNQAVDIIHPRSRGDLPAPRRLRITPTCSVRRSRCITSARWCSPAPMHISARRSRISTVRRASSGGRTTISKAWPRAARPKCERDS